MVCVQSHLTKGLPRDSGLSYSKESKGGPYILQETMELGEAVDKMGSGGEETSGETSERQGGNETVGDKMMEEPMKLTVGGQRGTEECA